jgi:hypothetical protein
MTSRKPVFLVAVTRTTQNLPPSFAPGLSAPHPPGHCLCSWVWAPSITRNRAEPWAMKYRNRACLISH